MYENFFGLRESPFKINPDPRYLVFTPEIEYAWERLRYGIEARKGLSVFTGEIGTGKTTLINRLLAWLDEQRAHTAFVFNPRIEPRHLLDFLLADFRVPFEADSGALPLKRLNHWLLDCYRANQIAVLIVDEAQGLSLDLLEEVRLLLNMETPLEKLLQVVLVGQPELEQTLKRRELRQLQQRIAVRCRTSPLTCEQTHAYIQARLRLAGSSEDPVFTDEAADSIHFYAQGIPRVINLLCEHALIDAYSENLRPVTVGVVENVAREFQQVDAHATPALTSCNNAPETLISGNPAPATASTHLPSATEVTGGLAPIDFAKPAEGSDFDRIPGHITGLKVIRDAAPQESEHALDSGLFASEGGFAPRSSGSTAESNRPEASKANSRFGTEPSLSHLLAVLVGMERPKRSGGTRLRKPHALLKRPGSLRKMRRSWTVSPGGLPVPSVLFDWWRQATAPMQSASRRSAAARRQELPTLEFRELSTALLRWLQQPWS